MPITVTCLGCDAQLTFPEEQAGILPLCPACAAKVSAPRQKAVAIPSESEARTSEASSGEANKLDVSEEPDPIAAPANEPPGEELLELGPRWRQVETAFAWIHFGIAAFVTGLVLSFFGSLLSTFFEAAAALPFSLLQYLMCSIAGFTILVGHLLCLRVPAGTGARPAAICCLAGRLLAFGLSFYGALSWWVVENTRGISGSYRESMLLTAVAFVLGGWGVSLLVEFFFLALVMRVGRFLEDRAVIRHARLGTRILIGYLIALLLLSVGGLTAVDYIETVQLQPSWGPPRSNWWLVNHLSDVLFATKKIRPLVAYSQLSLAVVVTVFWIALASQYRAALSAAKATIRDGLERREAAEKGLLVLPSRQRRENP